MKNLPKVTQMLELGSEPRLGRPQAWASKGFWSVRNLRGQVNTCLAHRFELRELRGLLKTKQILAELSDYSDRVVGHCLSDQKQVHRHYCPPGDPPSPFHAACLFPA